MKLEMINEEIIKKIRAAKSPEEISEIMKSAGTGISEESAANMFRLVESKGDLTDEELESAVGGCGSEPAQQIPNCKQCGTQMELYDVDVLYNYVIHYKYRCPNCHYESGEVHYV